MLAKLPEGCQSFSLVNLDENEGWLDLLDIVDASKDDDVVVILPHETMKGSTVTAHV